MESRTLGTFIAFLRKEKRLTQKQLAELLNVSDKTVSHWECDETSPDISLLPLLAEALGVTVDELLKREKKTVQPTVEHHYIPPKSENVFDKAEQFASRTANRIKAGMNGDTAERYRYFRLFSLIGTVISLVVLSRVAFSTAAGTSFGSYVNDLFIPGLLVLFGSLWTIAVSLGFTIGARLYFAKELKPRDGTEEKEYIYKANLFTYNNIFLVLCILPIPLIGTDDLPIWANIMIVLLTLVISRLVLTVLLTKKGIIITSKKKLLIIKYGSIFVVSALVVSWALLSFRYMYTSKVDYIIFDNSAEFIAYMETPKDKPENAYLIDGVEATTHPPTMPAPGNGPTVDSPIGVGQFSAELAEETQGESVLGYCGSEFVTFKWLNNEVVDCYYNRNDGTFHVITYEAKIKQKDMNILVDDGVPIVVVMFIVIDALTCLLLYKRKIKALKEGQ